MRHFLVLAGDATVLPWMQAVVDRGDRVVRIVTLQESLAGRVRDQFPGFETLPFIQPELISAPPECDSVLLSGADPSLFVAARQLGSTGLPVLVVTTSSGPSSALFDLMPLWEERRTKLVPGFSSGLEQFAEHLLGATIPSRVEFEREVPCASPLITEQKAFDWFFQDVHWLTRLAGHSHQPRWEHVQAIWMGQQQQQLAEGMVTLSGTDAAETTWRIKPTTGTERWRLTLWDGESSQAWTNADVPTGLQSDLTATLQRFDEALTTSSDDSWNDVLLCGHLLAGVQRSLLKQRKVPVHFEEISERNQFKTQMSAIGCGVLLWAMFGAILLLAVAGTMDPRDREQRTAQAADFILSSPEFTETGALTENGQRHIELIATNWSSTTAPVLIDLPESAGTTARPQVLAALQSHNLSGIDNRLLVRQRTGAWFERLVQLGWLAVFGPLLVFLAAQALIVLSNPGRSGNI